jgi:hypothetical protein
VRVLFIGRDWYASWAFANWLASEHDVCAYFVADSARYTNSYRIRWIRRRIKRKGLIRACDEALYHVYYELFQSRTNHRLLRRAFEETLGPGALTPSGDIPRYELEDLNDEKAIAALRRIGPDLCFATCISQRLSLPYLDVPKFGTVIYHEGLTPEYKGLYTAFWANYNREPHQIGYTLLQATDVIDAGPVLAQRTSEMSPELAKHWTYAGHQALIDGLPDVGRALQAVARGQAPRVLRESGAPRNYSYVGLSDEARRVFSAIAGRLARSRPDADRAGSKS